MEEIEKINQVYEGQPQRLDVYLKSVFPNFSRELLKKIIEDGMIQVNSKVVKPSYRLKPGDNISTHKVENTTLNNSVSHLNLRDIIVYEDNDIIVLNKPAGLLVHPTTESWINDYSTVEFFKETLVWLIYKQTDLRYSDVERLGLVHRLDSQTSGVMVVAKNLKSQKNIMEQFASRSVLKNYKAVVYGLIKEEKVIIDAPIGRLTGEKKLKVLEYGKDAITEISVIERGRTNCYIDIFPRTGRTNQIRVHLSYIKHPIVGDDTYGGIKFDRLMLHSYSLGFIHPSKNKKVFFKVEPDSFFKDSVSKLLK